MSNFLKYKQSRKTLQFDSIEIYSATFKFNILHHDWRSVTINATKSTSFRHCDSIVEIIELEAFQYISIFFLDEISFLDRCTSKIQALSFAEIEKHSKSTPCYFSTALRRVFQNVEYDICEKLVVCSINKDSYERLDFYNEFEVTVVCRFCRNKVTQMYNRVNYYTVSFQLEKNVVIWL